MDQATYKREIAPLLEKLLEKARKTDTPCLFAIQVEGEVRIGGNGVDASPQLKEAYSLLVHEDDESYDPGPMTRGSEIVE